MMYEQWTMILARLWQETNQFDICFIGKWWIYFIPICKPVHFSYVALIFVMDLCAMCIVHIWARWFLLWLIIIFIYVHVFHPKTVLCHSILVFKFWQKCVQWFSLNSEQCYPPGFWPISERHEILYWKAHRAILYIYFIYAAQCLL